MKSKNMVLMVVAIGCGLVAAFLTAKLSGGSSPDKIEVVVAKKELPVGTVLDEKELESMLGTMKFEKANLPPDVVLSADSLKGKRLNRTLKQGNYFSESDVAADSGTKLPEGTSKYAIKMDGVKAVAGFVNPGDKVDVIMTESTPNGKAKSGIILRDMLVLAVDIQDRRREGGQQAVLTVNSVSLAVTPKQSLTLSSALRRGEVSLLLRDPKSTDKANVEAVSKIEHFDVDDTTQATTGSALKMISVIVAKVEVPFNTQITTENYDKYFWTRDIPEEGVLGKIVPAQDRDKILGKFLTNKMIAEMPVYDAWLSDEKVEVATKVEPVKPDDLELLPAPREFVGAKPLYPRKFEQIINNQRVFFIELSPGEFRRLDGSNEEIKDLPPTNGAPQKKEEKTEEGQGVRAV